jgi:hypothetical protein
LKKKSVEKLEGKGGREEGGGRGRKGGRKKKRGFAFVEDNSASH